MSATDRSVGTQAVGVLNIGNTRTTAAVVTGGCVVRRWCCPTARREATAVASVLRRLWAAGARTLVIGSVVPAAARDWMRAARRDGRWPIVAAAPRLAADVKFDYPHPQTLGADRLANIVAVAHRGGPAVIVVDAGTATTFDAVIGDRYIGGVIAPGPAMFLEYLADRTAQLPRVRAARPVRAPLGFDTVSAMRVGAEAGFEGMVAGIVRRMREVAQLRRARVVATGGAAARVSRAVPGVKLDPDLTLRGLARLAEGVSGDRIGGRAAGSASPRSCNPLLPA